MAARDEVTTWVKLYTPDLYKYAISKVSDAVAAEDIVQNTFLSAFESFDNFQRKSQPKTWLFSILKHKVADFYRQKYKQIEYMPVKDPSDELFDKHGRLKAPCSSIEWRMDEELLDDTEFLEALQHCIESLPAKMSAVVELKYLYETDSNIVCENLNISKTNFWQIMHRAKLLLKTCLENKWFKQVV
ncbi:MAG: sigma-70 family RNA polymerase sigma factor [Flavisolibacter sp.]|jgi:RNA polymerase sigma-70 factor (ECF subfamily)|nr:sigma-70 family RNA polymerase sigma factor [Flavisolibacter sp.]